MKNSANQTGQLSDCIVTRSYEQYHCTILTYISSRINHKYEAEDLTQDVFIRLLDYRQMLQESTMRYFLFTIARNIVIDYLRRYYKKQEISSYIYDTTVRVSAEQEENFIANDLLALEREKLQSYSPQRKTVYSLSRFEEKSISEISQELQLSKRTVENHLLVGRRIMRTYIRQCI